MDAFIPLGPKDFEVFPYCLSGALCHLPEVGRVFVVTPEPARARQVVGMIGLTAAQRERVVVLNEATEVGVPFTLRTIQDLLAIRKPAAVARAGWYYQQLLKLYAPFVISGIAKTVLVLDADVIFLRETRFILSSVATEGRSVVLSYFPSEYANSYVHDCYYTHLSALAPEILPAITNRRQTFVSHHSVFEHAILTELFRMVEARWRRPFWLAFLEAIGDAHLEHSGASEYDLYGYFRKYLYEKKGLPAPARYLPMFEGFPAQPPAAGPAGEQAFIALHHYLRPRDWLSRLLDIQRARCLL